MQLYRISGDSVQRRTLKRIGSDRAETKLYNFRVKWALNTMKSPNLTDTRLRWNFVDDAFC